MGRSFYRPDAQVVPVGASFHHEASGRDYAFGSRGGKFYENRHQVGFGGKDADAIERQIDYVVGSGNHARTFLHRNPDGQLFEMPVSWYSERGGYLAMSPGYDNPHPEDFRRPVPDDCLFCHNGYPRANLIAEGIDCQRCHGPGQAHVASSGRTSLVNPAKLDRDRLLDVCMQCHLETTSLRLPNAIRRFNRAPFSFRPGEPLTDYELIFDRAPNSGFDDRLEVAHQAYRLRKSACFLKSKMTCTTCHDPHRVQTADHFVSACKSCHATSHSDARAAANCLDCHMWKRRTDDAVHVLMTDHFIQRTKPKRDLFAALPEAAPVYQGEVVSYFPPGAPELYSAVAQVEHESNMVAGIPRLETAISRDKPTEPDFYVELGKAYSKSGNQPAAIRWYEEALRHRQDFHPALRELAAALALSGDFAKAAQTGERASTQEQPDPIAVTNLGNAYLRNGNPDRAKEALERALAVNPDSSGAQNLLGLVWLAKQNPEAAESSFREAISLQPDMAEPHNNLANLLAGHRNYPEAAWHFRKAIEYDPAYADAHHSYGLLLALTRAWDQALAELREAVRLDPKSPQNHIDYGDALAGKRRGADAEAEYSRAVELAHEPGPEYYEAQLSLGAMMIRNGKTAEALPHFRKAAESSDPEIRQAAEKALR